MEPNKKKPKKKEQITELGWLDQAMMQIIVLRTSFCLILVGRYSK